MFLYLTVLYSDGFMVLEVLALGGFAGMQTILYLFSVYTASMSPAEVEGGLGNCIEKPKLSCTLQ